MRWVFSALLAFNVTLSVAQSKLTGASMTIKHDINSGMYHVKERLNFDVTEEGQRLKCKALLFSKGTNSDSLHFSMQSKNAQINYLKKTEAFHELQLTFLEANENDWIEMSYRIEVEPEITMVPLFFTELSAASSEEDFFQLNLEVSQNQSYYFHFPSVDINKESTLDGKKLVELIIPALPSLVKLELIEENSNAAMQTAFIDVGVAFALLLIGILIWNYRKILIHG